MKRITADMELKKKFQLFNGIRDITWKGTV